MRIEKVTELVNQIQAISSYTDTFYKNLESNLDDLPLKDSDKRTLRYNATSISNTNQLKVVTKLLETSKKRLEKSLADDTSSKGTFF